MITYEAARAEWEAEPLRLGQVAALLGVHIQTARSWVDSGRLKAFRTPTGERRVIRRDALRLMEL
jgi:excisionase family DNA binding protein